jgi:PhnB protein
MEFAPYLFITGGRCEEALNFYKSIFGGEITQVMRWSEAPKDMNLPADMGNRIMHSQFKAPGITFMASDATPNKQYGEGAISLSVAPTTEKEAKSIFDKLAQGGNIEMPLEKTFWNALFGMLTDKYGIDWMVNYQFSEVTASRN